MLQNSVEAKFSSSLDFKMVFIETVVGSTLCEPVNSKEVLVDGDVSILSDCAREACLK